MIVLVFPAANCWIHDANVIGLDLVEKSVLPISYFFVQYINVYGQK